MKSKAMLTLGWALAVTVLIASTGTSYAFGPAPKELNAESSWAEIEADTRLYVAYPQVIFALPDRGITFSTVADVCEATVNGVEVVRRVLPYQPCVQFSPVGGSAPSVCLKYGDRVTLERPKHYQEETCDRWDNVSSRWTCVASSIKDLTLETKRTVEVFTRINDHNNGWGGHPKFRKEFSIPRCQ